jgi:hypothetical protein
MAHLVGHMPRKIVALIKIPLPQKKKKKKKPLKGLGILM